jgi:hypothetical protein
LQCRNCGDVVDPRRVELGYDYCLKEECQQRCLKRVQLAAVGVNKAADYYMKAEEVLPPRPAAPGGTPGPPPPMEPDDGGGEPPEVSSPRARPAVNKGTRPKTTLERLQRMERALDDLLDRSYERFRRGEITATEMHRERDRLVDAFNQQVMRENIRYRSMLRGPANRAG